MALDFPNNPITGQTFTSGGITWVYDGTKWNIVVATGASVTVADTAPTAPIAGALWWDSVGGQMYIWYTDPNTSQWVPTTNLGTTLPEAPNDGQLYGRNGQAGAWQPAAPASLVSAPVNNTGRNLLHNPYMTVNQRASGPYSAVTGATTYGLDRWAIYKNDASDTASMSQQSITDAQRVQIGDEAAYPYLMQVVFTGGSATSANVQILHHIENVHRLSGKTVIVSFYASASAAMKLGASFNQSMGTGGSPSASTLGNGQSVNVTTAFARYSMPLTIPSTAGVTLGSNNNDYTELSFWLSANATTYATRSGGVPVQSGTIQIWGTQLEVAQPGQTQPTALERITPRQDLSNCQRFYCTGNILIVSISAGGNFYGWVPVTYPYQVPMRASPTVVATYGSGSQNPGAAIGGNNQCVQMWGNSAASGLGQYASFNFTASADL